jgi:hypothetical protein
MSFTGKLADWLVRQKDSSASLVIKRFVQKTISRYGDMINFNIDSRNKTVQLEVLLKGEQQPITLTVEEYELRNEDGAVYFVIKKATASREWVGVAVQHFWVGKKFRIPDNYSGMVKLVL